jgi:hypothetical protein
MNKTHGAVTVDHFVPKTKEIALVYEWRNYRLASLGANRLKSVHEDILDPFSMQPETFRLNLIDGRVFINEIAGFDAADVSLAESTINRLQINGIINLFGNVNIGNIAKLVLSEFATLW